MIYYNTSQQKENGEFKGSDSDCSAILKG